MRDRHSGNTTGTDSHADPIDAKPKMRGKTSRLSELLVDCGVMTPDCTKSPIDATFEPQKRVQVKRRVMIGDALLQFWCHAYSGRYATREQIEEVRRNFGETAVMVIELGARLADIVKRDVESEQRKHVASWLEIDSNYRKLCEMYKRS